MDPYYYYDPLYPTYEATRMQIEQTILGLEEKLIRRKQLNLLVQRDLMTQQAFQAEQRYRLLDQRQRQELVIASQYQAEEQLRKALKRLRTLEPTAVGSSLIKSQYDNGDVYSYRQKALQDKQVQRELNYIQKLKLLTKQNQLLKSQLHRSRSEQRSPHLLFNHKRQNAHKYQASYGEQASYGSNDDHAQGQDLVGKYHDGTRIQEYNQELQMGGNQDKRRYQDNENGGKKYGGNYSSVKKYNNEEMGRSQDERLVGGNNKGGKNNSHELYSNPKSNKKYIQPQYYSPYKQRNGSHQRSPDKNAQYIYEKVRQFNKKYQQQNGNQKASSKYQQRGSAQKSNQKQCQDSSAIKSTRKGGPQSSFQRSNKKYQMHNSAKRSGKQENSAGRSSGKYQQEDSAQRSGNSFSRSPIKNLLNGGMSTIRKSRKSLTKATHLLENSRYSALSGRKCAACSRRSKQQDETLLQDKFSSKSGSKGHNHAGLSRSRQYNKQPSIKTTSGLTNPAVSFKTSEKKPQSGQRKAQNHTTSITSTSISEKIRSEISARLLAAAANHSTMSEQTTKDEAEYYFKIYTKQQKQRRELLEKVVRMPNWQRSWRSGNMERVEV